jgi:hypothetical protein
MFELRQLPAVSRGEARRQHDVDRGDERSDEGSNQGDDNGRLHGVYPRTYWSSPSGIAMQHVRAPA